MAQLIPPHYPPVTSDGEKLVFDALCDSDVDPKWVVLHSLHIPVHVRQVEGEAAFVVLMPRLGVLCLEVKGVRRAEYANGVWYLGNDPKPNLRGPFRQAEEARRSVKKKVTAAYPSADAFLFWSAVVFTHCVPTSRTTGDWHPWELVTRDDLEKKPIGELLEGVMRSARDHVASLPNNRGFDLSSGRPSVADSEAIRQLLRPDVLFLPATEAIRKKREQEIRRFTEEQAETIQGLKDNERVIIEGAAGTGKSVLALEELRRALGDARKVALLCFNKFLATFLKQAVKDLGLEGAEISTTHGLMSALVGPHEIDPADEKNYLSEVLPDLCLALLLEEDPRFDMLIIDEAQDLGEPGYWNVMDALVVGGLRNGYWRVFGDFQGQNLAAEPKPIKA